jgi:transketolase
MNAMTDCRKPFAAMLERIAEADSRVVAVTNDSVGSSNLTGFKRRYPSRFVNVGIAEQNLIGVAAGLSNGGLVPFVCGAACFLTGRGLEQIKVDLGYGRANVKLCGMSGGVAYGPLGPTHHSPEDLAWTRVIPNLTVIVPADAAETAQAVEAAAQMDGPVFLRVSRMPVPDLHAEDYRFEIGRASRLCEGRDVTLIATGTMAARAVEAAGALARGGVSARVLNMATVKPIDREAVVAAALETGAIVTVEEHSTIGGLGGAVAEIVATEAPVPMRILGIPGVFAPTGHAAFVFEHFGLTAAGIQAAAMDLIERRRA